jgi:hypothetical protein
VVVAIALSFHNLAEERIMACGHVALFAEPP